MIANRDISSLLHLTQSDSIRKLDERQHEYTKNSGKKATTVSFVKLDREVLPYPSCHGEGREAGSKGTVAPDRHFNRCNEGN